MVGWWVVGGWWRSFGRKLFGVWMGWDEAPGTSSLEARPGNAGVPLMSERCLPARRFLNS